MLLVASVLTWEGIRAEEGAWNTLVWFAALVIMATELNHLGLMSWMSQYVAGAVGHLNWVLALALLVLVYFYVHYLFASQTAQIAAMYAGFLGAAIVVGVPPLLAALVFGFASNLFGSMTQYGCGPAPALFGSGYVDVGNGGNWSADQHCQHCDLGGGIWWKLIGLY